MPVYAVRISRKLIRQAMCALNLKRTQYSWLRALFLQLGLSAILLWPVNLFAQQASSPPPTGEELVVAAAHCPPFVISENGKLSGLAIYLWERLAVEIGVSYQLVEIDFAKLLEAIASQEVSRRMDVGISCLSITAEREKTIDFSHSFYETYTGIAVHDEGVTGTLHAALTNPVVLRALLVVLVMAVLVGGLFYVLEHKINDKLYAMKTPSGRFMEALVVGALFVTRGPIRYYEFKTPLARILSALLAIGSTFLIAGVTAVLAGAFTLENLQNQINGLQDLQRVRVGAMADSTSSALLERHGIIHQKGTDLETLLADLDRGRLDAVVSDEAFLRYSIRKQQEQGSYQSLYVLPQELETQNYGFGLQIDSPHRESINQAMLQARKSPDWKAKLAQYIGK